MMICAAGIPDAEQLPESVVVELDAERYEIIAFGVERDSFGKGCASKVTLTEESLLRFKERYPDSEEMRSGDLPEVRLARAAMERRGIVGCDVDHVFGPDRWDWERDGDVWRRDFKMCAL
jgi:hypothetical protein